MLGESAIAVRTKAMKCLSEVVAVDPSILGRVSHFHIAAVLKLFLPCLPFRNKNVYQRFGRLEIKFSLCKENNIVTLVPVMTLFSMTHIFK